MTVANTVGRVSAPLPHDHPCHMARHCPLTMLADKMSKWRLTLLANN